MEYVNPGTAQAEALARIIGEAVMQGKQPAIVAQAPQRDVWSMIGQRLGNSVQQQPQPQPVDPVAEEIYAAQELLRQKRNADILEMRRQAQQMYARPTEEQMRGLSDAERIGYKIGVFGGEGQGQARGEKPPSNMPVDVRKRLLELKSGLDNINELEAVINDPKYERKLSPIWGREGLNTKYDEDQGILDSVIRRTRQNIGKAMEGGVLRKEDEAKYEAMLPAMTDTPAVAKEKLRRVRSMLETQYRDAYAAGSHFNQEGLFPAADIESIREGLLQEGVEELADPE